MESIPDFNAMMPSDDSDADSPTVDEGSLSLETPVVASGSSSSPDAAKQPIPARMKLSEFVAPPPEAVDGILEVPDSEEDTDETVRLAELAAVDQRVTPSGRNGYVLVIPGRKLLMDGTLLKKGTESRVKRTNPRTAFLFNDSLLLTKEEGRGKLKFKDEIPLTSSIIEDTVGDVAAEANSFVIHAPKKSYTLIAPTADAKEKWMAALSTAVWRAAPPDVRTKPGWRHMLVTGTLFHASVVGDADLVKRLCELGAFGVNEIDRVSWSPLQYACYFGHVDVVDALLAAGAVTGVRTVDHRSLYHLAILRGHVDVVTVLCNNGLETNVEDGWGNTPLLAALLTVSTLGADAVTPIACALITAGATVNGTSNSGKPAVLLAVEAGLAHVLALMVTKGVHTNVKCGARVESPLHVALQRSPVDPATVTVLLKGGCQPNGVDCDGNSPLHVLLHRMAEATANGAPVPPEWLGVIQTLLRYGARLDVKNSSGVTCGGALASFPMVGTADSIAHYSRRMCPTGYQPPAGLGIPVSANCRSKYGVQQKLYHVCPKDQWVADAASDSCFVCRAAFGFLSRKHHCRHCGLLLCGGCCSHTFPLIVTAHPLVVSPSDRVCDGCFNLLSEFPAVQQAVAMSQRVEATSPVSPPVPTLTSPPPPIAAGSGRAAPQPPPRSAQRGSQSGAVSDLKDTMAQAQVGLSERGERLEALGRKTQELADSAGEFEKMATLLAKRYS